jgi:hypothetical protein
MESRVRVYNVAGSFAKQMWQMIGVRRIGEASPR